MHPGSARGGDDAGDLDPTRLEIDYEEHEVPSEPSPRDRFNREEVGRGNRSPVRLQKGLPGHGPPARGIDSVLRKAVFIENPLDRRPADLMAEVPHHVPDSRVTPAHVLLGQLDD